MSYRHKWHLDGSGVAGVEMKSRRRSLRSILTSGVGTRTELIVSTAFLGVQFESIVHAIPVARIWVDGPLPFLVPPSTSRNADCGMVRRWCLGGRQMRRRRTSHRGGKLAHRSRIEAAAGAAAGAVLHATQGGARGSTVRKRETMERAARALAQCLCEASVYRCDRLYSSGVWPFKARISTPSISLRKCRSQPISRASGQCCRGRSAGSVCGRDRFQSG